MYRLRFELKGFLHVGQFSHISTHLLQIKCPSRHWKMGGTICSKHTGHSNKRINWSLRSTYVSGCSSTRTGAVSSVALDLHNFKGNWLRF